MEPRRSSALQLWPWLAAVVTGALLALCFPPWNQEWLVWIALTPLICALFFSKNSGRYLALRKAALGYVAAFVFFTSTFFWLSTTLAELYQNVWLLALAPLVAMVFACYWALWSAFVGALLVRDEAARRFPTSLKNIAIAGAAAAAWVAHEWVREWLFGGFGWNPLGVALHRDLALIQIADITGVHGLTFLIAFCNLMAVIIVRRIAGELGPVFLKRIRWEFSFTMALVALVFAYGVRTLLRGNAGATVPLRVAAIQPNTPQTEKFDPASEDKVFEQLRRLTSYVTLVRPAPELILWPEAALPRGMFADEGNYHFVLDQIRGADFALLTGSVDSDPARHEDYNIAALLTERGARQQFYRKIHLVPFGEYLPLRPIFGGLCGQLVPSDFTPGHESTLLELPAPKIKLAALICFEDTLGDLTRRFAKNGAQLLVNITNDGWFLHSPAAEQHLANARFRAIETRLPLVRCGNTGITCAIDSSGRIDRWLQPFEQGFGVREMHVPTTPAATFYTRHGDWLPHLACAITLLALVLCVRRRRTATV